MARLRACIDCGTPTVGRRCDRHRLAPRPRGASYEAVRAAVAERDGWRCALCGRPINPMLRRPHPDALNVDHIQPRASHGPTELSNLRATHASCNRGRPRWSPG